MTLQVQFTDDEVPELVTLLDKALNTADPATTPKWWWDFERAVQAKFKKLQLERQRATLLAALGEIEHSVECPAVSDNVVECVCGASAARVAAIFLIDQELGLAK